MPLASRIALDGSGSSSIVKRAACWWRWVCIRKQAGGACSPGHGRKVRVRMPGNARQKNLRQADLKPAHQLERLTQAYLENILSLDEYRRRHADLEAERQAV